MTYRVRIQGICTHTHTQLTIEKPDFARCAKSQSGRTLLETIAVLVIAAILLLASTVGYNVVIHQWRKHQTVKQITELAVRYKLRPVAKEGYVDIKTIYPEAERASAYDMKTADTDAGRVSLLVQNTTSFLVTVNNILDDSCKAQLENGDWESVLAKPGLDAFDDEKEYSVIGRDLFKNWNQVPNSEKPENLKDKTKDELISYLCQAEDGKIRNTSLIWGSSCSKQTHSYWYSGKCWPCPKNQTEDTLGNCCEHINECGYCEDDRNKYTYCITDPKVCHDNLVCKKDSKQCVECLKDTDCCLKNAGNICSHEHCCPDGFEWNEEEQKCVKPCTKNADCDTCEICNSEKKICELDVGKEIPDCGVCDSTGIVVTDETKLDACHTCTPSWELAWITGKENYTACGTECCENGCDPTDSTKCAECDGDKDCKGNKICNPTTKTCMDGCLFNGTVYENNALVGNCGVCNNGTITANSSQYDTTCQTCTAANNWERANVTNGSNKQSDGKCCVGGTLAYDVTLCPAPCSFGGNTYNSGDTVEICGKCINGTITTDTTQVTDCYTCNEDTWTLDEATDATRDASGKCCVSGVRTYDSTLCPATCSFGGNTYNSGDTVETCGKCANGTITTDETQVTDCHTCNTDTWTLNKTNDSTRDDSGKCCANGTRTYDATLCPAPCSFGESSYASGTTVGTCGKCVNGSITADTTKVDACHTCNSTWELVLKEGVTETYAACGTQCCANGCDTTDNTKCAKVECPSDTTTQCSKGGNIVSTLVETLSDGTKCYKCSCASGTIGYKAYPQSGHPAKWTTADAPTDLKYCCDPKTQPVPTKGKVGSCDYCEGSDWSCSKNSDCPEGSFCFNSGDSNGWHCHGLNKTGNIWRSVYYVETGGVKVCNFPSARKKVAENLCSALGKRTCCSSVSDEYSWGSGTCYKGGSSCTAKSDSTCDGQKSLSAKYGKNSTFGDCANDKGGIIICC